MRRWQKVLAVALLVITIAAGARYYHNRVAINEIQASLKDYLENKYHREFVVEPFWVGEGEFFADAYPKNQPEMRFQVQRSKRDQRYFYDYYSSARMSYEGSKEIKPFMDSLYKQDVKLRCTAYSRGRKHDRLSYKEMISKYPGNLGVQITAYIFVNEVNRELEANRVHILLNDYIASNKIGYKTVLVFYLKPAYKDEFDKMFANQKVFLEKWDPIELRKNGTLLNSLSVLDKNATDPESIERRFR